MLKKNEKRHLHQKLGAFILGNLKTYDQSDYFQAVNHLNMSFEELSKGIFQAENIILNIHAASLAIKKSAFERAFKYFSFADLQYKILKPYEIVVRDPKLIDVFKSNRLGYKDLNYAIKFGMAESMFLMQKFEQALLYVNEVLNSQINRHQKVKATYIKVRICSALMNRQDTQQLLLDGIESLESVLADFAVIVPDNPERQTQEVNDNCRQIKQMINKFNNENSFTELLNKDQEYQDLIKLIVNSLTFLYYMDVKKHIYIAIKTLLITIQKGLTPISPVLFAASFITTSFNKDYVSLSFLLGNYSLQMIMKPPYKNYAHIVYYVATLNFYAWQNHYKKCIQQLQKSVRWALESGDHHYVSFCSTNIRLLDTYRGKNLKQHVVISRNSEKQSNHVFFISSSDNDLTAFLLGQKPGFQEGNFTFSEDLIRESSYNMSSKYHLNLALEKLYFLSGNFETALEAGNICENLEKVYHGFQIEIEHNFYYCLIQLQMGFLHNTFYDIYDIIKPKLQELKRLSAYGSGNYLHKVYLIEAEIEKCKGNFEHASELYDKAIQEALNQEFINAAAIAAELAANYYLYKGRVSIGHSYMKDALKYYTRWGADAKVEWLKRHYPEIKRKSLKKEVSHRKNEYQILKSILNKTTVSEQIKVDELGKYLLDHLMKFTFSQQGVILILKQGNWYFLTCSDPTLSYLESESINMVKNEFPKKIFNYAINKKSSFILEKVNKIPLFENEAYLKDTKIDNIFCYPVMNTADLVGFIYLENLKKNIHSDFFTIVAEHVAIALANAIYNENMNQLHKELQLQEQKRINTVIETQEKERRRIAEELHDSVGQMLALIKLNFSRLESEAQLKLDNHRLLTQTSQLLDESCNEVRNISHNLMPPDFRRMTLVEIIEKLVKKMLNVNECSYQFHAYDVSATLPEAIKFTIYRIIQEILHNIVKHAAASNISVNLTQLEDGINLMVEDNGKGFDKSMVTMGLGLKNIHSRVQLLNGYFDIDSSLRRGTIYNITIPLNT